MISDHRFMRIRRKFPVLFGFLLFVAAVGAVVFLQKHAPPAAARLLPGADAFVYVDLKWMRRADIANHLPAVPHDPEYEQFIEATEFQFERDLKEAAVAIHYASPSTGGETRFSEVFVAKIDGDKLRAYLKKMAASVETYRAVDIYSIPLQNRTVRVAIIGVDTVAISNHNDPDVIRGIIYRSRRLASPFRGPDVMRQFYKQVPLASLVWAIFRVNPSSHGIPSQLAIPLSSPATIVASVRYLGSIHFRAEAFTKDEQAAEQLTSQLSTFLAIFQTAEVSSSSGQTSDPDIKKMLESLKVSQHKDRALLTAIVPVELVRKIVSEAPAEVAPKSGNKGTNQ